MEIMIRIRILYRPYNYIIRLITTGVVSLSLTMSQVYMTKREFRLDTTDIDSFNLVAAKLDVHSTVGKDLSNRVRTFHSGLELVREPQIHLLPNHVANTVVVTDSLSVCTH